MDQSEIKKALENEITPFAVTTFRNRERIFGIKTDDRRRHVYLIGKTGMGKTTLIENMVYSDIIAGHGVCYVDPHGDTAEKMLSWIPASRINDVIYFNPADIENPISFNVLEKVAPEYRHLIASGLIGVFKKLWADSWGPRLEYLLRNAILALLEYPDSTLLGINRLLVDKEYRNKVISKVQDPVIKAFWTEEYTKYGPQFQVEAISPIQNKIGQFLSTSLIRNIVGQVKSTIDIRKAMDDGKILILNLSKGRIGEDASALLGSMMVTKIQLAAMSRVDIHEEQRKDFYLYVDEFQNFATDSFANILSEARKYRLNLIIAHQYIEQLGEVVQPAVFGNVGTMICFRIGAADAEFLEQEFAPNILPEDLVNLPKYEFYLKLMIEGVASEPFSARGLPPIFTESLGNEEKVVRASRERYTKPREVVEDKIKRWSFSETSRRAAAGQEKRFEPSNKRSFEERDRRPQSFQPQPAKSGQPEPLTREERGKKRKQRSDQAKYQATCFNCQKEIEVPFKPDNIRPVFCQDCLKKARRGEIKLAQTKAPVASQIKPAAPEEGIPLTQIKDQTVNFKGKPAEAAKAQPQKEAPKPQKPAEVRPAVKVEAAKREEKRFEQPQVKPVMAPQMSQVKPVMTKPQPIKKEEKRNLPSANLLGVQDNKEKKVNLGETIEL